MLLAPPNRLNTSIIFNSSRHFNIPVNCNNPRTTFFTDHSRCGQTVPKQVVNISGSTHNGITLHVTLRAHRRRVHHRGTGSGVYATRILLTGVTDFCTICRNPRKLGQVTRHIRQLAYVLTTNLRHGNVIQIGRRFFSALALRINNTRATVVRDTGTIRVGLHVLKHKHLNLDLSRAYSRAAITQLLSVFLNTSRNLGIRRLSTRALISNVPSNLLHDAPCLHRPIFDTRRDRARVLHCLGRLRGGSLTLGRSVVPLNSYAVGLGTADRVVPVA